jgi:2-methylcitrate dehydratase PrpD
MTAPAAPRFAEFALGLNGNDLPDVVARAAKEHLLDAVGCALAAVGLGEAPAAARVALERGGVAQATGIGCPTAMPSASAALVNGTLAHGLDFDDTRRLRRSMPAATS